MTNNGMREPIGERLFFDRAFMLGSLLRGRQRELPSQ
jgi:hypothetical protein